MARKTASNPAAEISAELIEKHHARRAIAVDAQRLALALAEMGCSKASNLVLKAAVGLLALKPGQVAP